MNLWLVGFIISWITFFILIDYKRILPNILAGIAALAAQITIDSTGGTLGLYLITS